MKNLQGCGRSLPPTLFAAIIFWALLFTFGTRDTFGIIFIVPETKERKCQRKTPKMAASPRFLFTPEKIHYTSINS